MDKIIQVRIPNGLYKKMEDEIKSRDYMHPSEIVREALREFFEKPKPRRINSAVEAIATLIEEGPKEFSKKLKEDGDERE